MTHDRHQDTIDYLDDLLDQERAALLQGNLDEIARLHPRKEHLIDGLNHPDMSNLEGLTELNFKLERNQTLLDNALDGVRSVARRLAAIRRVRQSLETYDSSGRKTSVILAADSSVEKRA